MARRRQTATLLASTLEAQVAMWVTLGVRVPQLMAGTMTGAEWNRMVAEKASAAAESAWETSFALGRAMLVSRAPRSSAAAMDQRQASDEEAARDLTLILERVPHARRHPGAGRPGSAGR